MNSIIENIVRVSPPLVSVHTDWQNISLRFPSPKENFGAKRQEQPLGWFSTSHQLWLCTIQTIWIFVGNVASQRREPSVLWVWFSAGLPVDPRSKESVTWADNHFTPVAPDPQTIKGEKGTCSQGCYFMFAVSTPLLPEPGGSKQDLHHETYLKTFLSFVSIQWLLLAMARRSCGYRTVQPPLLRQTRTKRLRYNIIRTCSCNWLEEMMIFPVSGRCGECQEFLHIARQKEKLHAKSLSVSLEGTHRHKQQLHTVSHIERLCVLYTTRYHCVSQAAIQLWGKNWGMLICNMHSHLLLCFDIQLFSSSLHIH